MLQTNILRENTEDILRRLEKRGDNSLKNLVTEALDLDKKKREKQAESDSLLAEMNKASKEIGILMKDGKREEAELAKAKVAEIKSKSQDMKQAFASLEAALNTVLYQIPNVPNESVPAGKTEDDNEEVYSEGSIPNLGENARPHWDLADEYKLIDFQLGVKITGAGFPLYTGKGAKLQRALINFFLDEAEKSGYEELIPPFMVNEESGYGTGQLPDKEGQMYHVTEDDLYLIPTSEVPITNVYRDVILNPDELPIKHCAYSPCFRREAGSYGKDVRGLNRLHQFEKVEIVQIAKPDESYKLLEEMVEHVKGILRKLELPYRVLRLCGGDLGFTSAITYDFEVYSGAQKRWLEVSSVSNFEAFQSNRLKCRYRTEEKKTELVHTLNGSAMALPRIMAALLENNQITDGIAIPEALQRYTGFAKIEKK
ncbi:MAG TPA: serine--tRNA ligase [Cryomorphaceae bacterium]|nr:serine--tRNA ligase [Cryomorphaceae bacterium]